jgi:hypothetical protein
MRFLIDCGTQIASRTRDAQQGCLGYKLIRNRMEPGATAMQEVHYSALFWLFGLIQLSGWASGFLTRWSARWRHQSLCHAAFFLTLLMVGICTPLTLALGAKCWLLSATTLAGMILLAIWDFDHRSRPATI